MLVNKPETAKTSQVKFVSYDGAFPNLCSGRLVLSVNGKEYAWERRSGFLNSGGGLNPGYRGTYSGEWEIDYAKIPDEIKEFANEIDKCINEKISYGCCGGCI